MDYHFENLNPERFQQFCQALLTAELTNVQCFPVGQPDGGRDASACLAEPGHHEFIVYQVKFVRRPQLEPNAHKSLAGSLKAEIPKVEELAAKGAHGYYVLTNVSGTAHPVSGSIDQVQAILSQLPISAQCWWRDDLSRRVDNHWDLKWVYPEIMSGTDMLRYVIENHLSEDKERRASAIGAFVRDQYVNDQKVRFKQVDLHNRLLDLFIDVPVDPGRGPTDESYRQYHYVLQTIARRHSGREADGLTEEAVSQSVVSPSEYSVRWEEEHLVGAATMLLDPDVQKHVSQVVLEGAPGQGKSTIAQYVCQVHRMRILGEDRALADIPEWHKNTAVRIPFRVDLRDFATWLGKQDPFSAEDNGSPPPHWHKSLEAFLAAQVRHHSGGVDFSVADLHAVAKISAVLLVLDGLDEVAEISRRREVVDEAIAGINRLKDSALSLQVVVTSRPAAFANSPGFPEEDFLHCQLASLSKPIVYRYADKWLKARKLRERDSVEVKRILRAKMDQPHLRDLARNPMQLAILLTLIHTRGSSLPDKRTALYDSYVGLFFDREAEKSSIVREYRDLLVDIHRYLAWILHSEAEGKNNRGSISSERLRRLLVDYLTGEGRDPSLAEQLFTGMVERVVALVSRVQGIYEFDVQPLREYFAARYLYDTAPYSPPGRERTGTKPDRFDAIAQNFFWLNVCRFYAGCFCKGELPALIDRLQELVQKEGYKDTSHPRVLAAMLLSDWVFAQVPKSMREVIRLVLDDVGVRYLVTAASRRGGLGVPLVLPVNSGREQLLDRCFEVLAANPSLDYGQEVTNLLKANSPVDDLKRRWMPLVKAATGPQRTRWLQYGLYLGLLSDVETAELEGLLADDPHNAYRLNLLFRAKQVSLCEGCSETSSFSTWHRVPGTLGYSEERCRAIVQSILHRELTWWTAQRAPSILGAFAQLLDSSRYAISFRSPLPVALAEVIKTHYAFGGEALDAVIMDDNHLSETLDKCKGFIAVAREEQRRFASEWAVDLAPWDRVVEASRAIWGDEWASFHLANVAAGIRSAKETCKDYIDLLDHSRPLCPRARYARLRAGSIEWWRRQFDQVKSRHDAMFVCLMLLSWASPNTLAALAEKLDDIARTLPDGHWHLPVRSAQEALALRADSSHLTESQVLPVDLSPRTVSALAVRASDARARDLYLRYLQSYDGAEACVLDFCQAMALGLLRSDPGNWRKYLAVIAKGYAKGIMAGAYYGKVTARGLYLAHSYLRRSGANDLPFEAAVEIIEHPELYPHFLVIQAEVRCRGAMATGITPVAEIARTEGWFVEKQ